MSETKVSRREFVTYGAAAPALTGAAGLAPSTAHALPLPLTPSDTVDHYDVGDSIVHASSCGQQLSFLTTGGHVLRAHGIDELSMALPDGQDGVCATTTSSVKGFDATGEQRWSLDIPNLTGATIHDGVLYALGGEAGLEISAFSL